MANNKKLNKKAIIISIIAIFVVGLSSFGIVSAINKDYDTISSTKFEVGGVSSLSGEHLESDLSIYTPESFKCQGLQVEKDFDAKGTFSVFYYDLLDKFIGVDKNIVSSKYVIPEEFKNSVSCRIVITPVLESDQDKIKFYQVAGIANDYKIKVSKDQNIENLDLFVGTESNWKLIAKSDTQEEEKLLQIDGYCETNGLTQNIDLKNSNKKFVSLYVISKIDLLDPELLSDKDDGNLLSYRLWPDSGYQIFDFSNVKKIPYEGKYLYDLTDFVNSYLSKNNCSKLGFTMNYLKSAKPQIYVA